MFPCLQEAEIMAKGVLPLTQNDTITFLHLSRPASLMPWSKVEGRVECNLLCPESRELWNIWTTLNWLTKYNHMVVLASSGSRDVSITVVHSCFLFCNHSRLTLQPLCLNYPQPDCFSIAFAVLIANALIYYKSNKSISGQSFRRKTFWLVPPSIIILPVKVLCTSLGKSFIELMVRDGKMDLSFRLPAVLMQERDGSQGTNSRLSIWSLSPMDRYPENSKRETGAEPCPDKR